MNLLSLWNSGIYFSMFAFFKVSMISWTVFIVNGENIRQIISEDFYMKQDTDKLSPSSLELINIG